MKESLERVTRFVVPCHPYRYRSHGCMNLRIRSGSSSVATAWATIKGQPALPPRGGARE